MLEVLARSLDSPAAEEREDALIRVSLALELYSVSPEHRPQARPRYADLLPEDLLVLDPSEKEVKRLITCLLRSAMMTGDASGAFWALGRARSSWAALPALRLLRESSRKRSLAKVEARQAAWALNRLLARPSPRLRHVALSPWLARLLESWIGDDWEELREEASRLHEVLECRW